MGNGIELEVDNRPNSVEIGITSKGMFSGKVKVYAETIEEAMSKAKERADELQVYLNRKNN